MAVLLLLLFPVYVLLVPVRQNRRRRVRNARLLPVGSGGGSGGGRRVRGERQRDAELLEAGDRSGRERLVDFEQLHVLQPPLRLRELHAISRKRKEEMKSRKGHVCVATSR